MNKPISNETLPVHLLIALAKTYPVFTGDFESARMPIRFVARGMGLGPGWFVTC